MSHTENGFLNGEKEAYADSSEPQVSCSYLCFSLSFEGTMHFHFRTLLAFPWNICFVVHICGSKVEKDLLFSFLPKLFQPFLLIMLLLLKDSMHGKTII